MFKFVCYWYGYSNYIVYIAFFNKHMFSVLPQSRCFTVYLFMGYSVYIDSTDKICIISNMF